MPVFGVGGDEGFERNERNGPALSVTIVTIGVILLSVSRGASS